MRKDARVRQKSILSEGGSYSWDYQEEGKRYMTLEARYCSDMRTRCLNPKYKADFPTYKDVTMVESFLSFDNFATWCNNQKGFGNLGWVLDKDILIPHNKVYSPEACVFIPVLINSFMTFSKTNRGVYPAGVSLNKPSGKYMACCSELNGKNKTLGRFSTPEEAHDVYLEFKTKLSITLSERFEGQVDDRVTSVLRNINLKDYL